MAIYFVEDKTLIADEKFADRRPLSYVEVQEYSKKIEGTYRGERLKEGDELVHRIWDGTQFHYFLYIIY